MLEKLLSQAVLKGEDVNEIKKTLINTIPLGRTPAWEDVAYAAMYLASDEISMLTGFYINADGVPGI